MNIKDLKPSEYETVEPTNINDLPAGSFEPVSASASPTVSYGGVALNPKWQPNMVSKLGNAVLGGASDLGVHLGQGLAKSVGKVATALGNTTLEQQVKDRLAAGEGQKNLFGEPVDPLQAGVTGAKQLGGDLLRTGAEAAALGTAPASIPGAIGAGAVIGAAEAGGQALQDNKDLVTVGTEAAKGGAFGAIYGGAAAGFSKLLGAIGDKIQLSTIRPTAADRADGFSLDTVKKYDLGGPINKVLDKSQSKIGELSTQLNTKLGATDATVDLDDVVKATVQELTDSSKFKGFGANGKILSTLDTLKNEVGIVGNKLSIPDAQVVKQASGSFGAWQYGKPDPDSKATEIVYNTFYNKLKTAIEKNSPEGVQAINKQLGEVIPVFHAALRRLPVAERNNLISLTDMIGLVGSSHNPAALGPTLLNLLSKSGTVGNALMKFGPKLQKAAPPAALIGSQAAQGSDTAQ